MGEVQIVPEETDSPFKSKNMEPSEFDLEFLETWGFTLKDTYKLTLRFYKGESRYEDESILSHYNSLMFLWQ